MKTVYRGRVYVLRSSMVCLQLFVPFVKLSIVAIRELCGCRNQQVKYVGIIMNVSHFLDIIST